MDYPRRGDGGCCSRTLRVVVVSAMATTHHRTGQQSPAQPRLTLPSPQPQPHPPPPFHPSNTNLTTQPPNPNPKEAQKKEDKKINSPFPLGATFNPTHSKWNHSLG